MYMYMRTFVHSVDGPSSSSFNVMTINKPAINGDRSVTEYTSVLLIVWGYPCCIIDLF